MLYRRSQVGALKAALSRLHTGMPAKKGRMQTAVNQGVGYLADVASQVFLMIGNNHHVNPGIWIFLRGMLTCACACMRCIQKKAKSLLKKSLF